MTDSAEPAPKDGTPIIPTEEYAEKDIVTTRLTKPKRRILTEEQKEIKREQCRNMREKKKELDQKRKKLKDECDDAAIENLANITKLDKLRRDGNKELVDEMVSLKEEIKTLRESKKPKPKKVRPPSPPPSATEGDFVTGSSEEESEPLPLKTLPPKRRSKKAVSETDSDIPVERPKTSKARGKPKPPQEDKSVQLPPPPKKILLFR
tara:strand:- start:301 stop:921 length:621 start_codon:yes stop_codon:yes gene_type:complete